MATKILKYFFHKKRPFDIQNNILVNGLKDDENKFIIVEDGKERFLQDNEVVPGLRVVLTGKNCTIKVHYPIRFLDSLLYITGDNCYFEIGSTPYTIDWKNEFCITAPNCSIKISTGQNCRFWGFNRAGLSIKIGDDCMFSHNVIVCPSDGHDVFSITTNEVLNKGEDVNIKNHVWVCEGATVSKGAYISDNCIVGAKSFVNKKFIESGSILAGIPAKVIKKDINWRR